MLLPIHEELNIEFKSDRNKLSDNDIIDAVVGLANTDGGVLYLGIEDDGNVTGIHKDHEDFTMLSAFIANKTVPPVSVRCEMIEQDEKKVLAINVSKSKAIVATSSGKILRRRIKMDGAPECVPMYPYEITTRLSDLSLLDFSAQPVLDASVDDFDPIERARLRNLIKLNYGDGALLTLTDEELDKALQLTKDINGQTIPTVAGILLLGRSEAIKKHIPTAETTIQILNGTNVVVNESFHISILAVFEKVLEYFNAWNPSTELEMGLVRIDIPEFDKKAFREAIVNAFCHRDYSVLGRVRIVINDDGLTISNPGGFIEGISIDSLIYAEPHGRNPVLADALKRIGLAERTGRGIDRIYAGSLFYGRPIPDYTSSTERFVNLFISKSAPDKNFVRILTQEVKKTGREFSVEALLILNAVKQLRRISVKQISSITNISSIKVQTLVERLVETGILEGIGDGKSRTFMLSSSLYKYSNNVAGYVRQSGATGISSKELVVKMCREQGYITKKNVVDLLYINDRQAYKLLKGLCDEGVLISMQKGHYAKYGLK